MSFDKFNNYTLSSFIFILVLFPLTVVCIFKFYRKRNQISVAKRYPHLALINGILFAIYILLIGICLFFYSKLNTFINAIVMGIFFVQITILLCVVVLRYWLLYYNICLSKSLLNMEWLNVINPFRGHHCSETCHHDHKYDNIESFFIQNKGTYGNVSYTSKICVKYILYVGCPMWAIFGIGEILYFSEYSKTNGLILKFTSLAIFFLFFLLPYLLFLVVLWKQSLHWAFYDTLYVGKELKWLLYSQFICFFVSIGIGVSAKLSNVDFTNPRSGDFVYILVDFSTSAISAFINIFISLVWVPLKLSQKEKREQIENNANTSVSKRKRRARLSKKLVKEMEKTRLLDILPDILLFEAFMQLLAKEFCSEALLSVVEFTQYQNYMMKICRELNIDSNKDSNNSSVVRFHDTVNSFHYFPTMKSSQTFTDIDDEEDNGSGVMQLMNSLPSTSRALDKHRTSSYNNSLSNANSLMDKRDLENNSVSQSGLILPRISMQSVISSGFLPSSTRTSMSDATHLQSILSLSSDNSNTAVNRGVVQRLVLPNEIPQSLIVYPGKGDKGECIQALLDKGSRINCSGKSIIKCSRTQLLYCSKKKAYLLYHKYIEYRAEYEINIAYVQRLRFHEKMNDFEEFARNEDVSLLDLTTIFDECIKDMFRLMMQSFSRFKNSAEFEKLFIAKHKNRGIK